MTPRQRVVITLIAIAIPILVVEMVRRRKLREEYAWIWLLAAAVIFVFLIRYDWLVYLSSALGVVVVTSTVFLLATLFFLIIGLEYASHLSKLNDQIKNLTQTIALLEERQVRMEIKYKELEMPHQLRTKGNIAENEDITNNGDNH